jgi:hypothetical protein
VLEHVFVQYSVSLMAETWCSACDLQQEGVYCNDKVSPVEGVLEGISSSFTLNVAPMSVSVIVLRLESGLERARGVVEEVLQRHRDADVDALTFT